METLVLWIWKNNPNPQDVETIRAALRAKGIAFEERVEDVEDEPVRLTTPFPFDVTVDTLDDFLSNFGYNKEGQMTYRGKTAKELDDQLCQF